MFTQMYIDVIKIFDWMSLQNNYQDYVTHSCLTAFCLILYTHPYKQKATKQQLTWTCIMIILVINL